MVQDSKADGEYAECLLKARFFEAARRPLELIETLKFEGDFVRLERHLARMAAPPLSSAWRSTARRPARRLRMRWRDRAGALRVRLTLDEAGRIRPSAAPLPPNPPHWTYALSPERVAERRSLAAPQDQLARTL